MMRLIASECRGRNSVVECSLPKADVVGSNPIARYSRPRRTGLLWAGFGHGAMAGNSFDASWLNQFPGAWWGRRKGVESE
jgi:hypothetical protein